ncbi:MAG: glyoxalase [Planctomycetota bacterium]
MITLLDHAQLTMPAGGEDQARAYFTGLLGMAEEPKPGLYATRGGCWFRAGAVSIHLGVEDGFRPQKKAHLALCVEQLDVLVAKLSAAGYLVDWETAVPSRRRFYTNDPFGNRLEFIADGDGFSQRDH